MSDDAMRAVSARAFRTDIQGLRAIAVLLVVIFHSGLGGVPGGFVGVDVFFVISGYLIGGLLLREAERSGGVALIDFYARRVRRLLPAAALVVLVVVIVAWFTYVPLELRSFAPSAIAASVYASNLWFARKGTDYLAEGLDSDPLLHTWSLAVEEQFYLAWPLLVLIAARCGARRGVRRRVLIAAVAVCVLSFLAELLLMRYSQPWAFFGSPARAWEFGCGAAIATMTANPWRSRVARDAAGAVGLLLIFGAGVAFSEHMRFPGYAALVPVAGTALALASAHGGVDTSVGRWLSVRPLTWIGDVSYSLYLWHWPVFIFLARSELFGRYSGALVGLAVSLGLAVATWYAVENPLRFSKRLRHSLPATAALAVALAVVPSGLALMQFHSSQLFNLPPAQLRTLAVGEDQPATYADGCHIDFFRTASPDCRYASRDSQRSVVLVGDSHAAHWFPALESVAMANNWQLVSLTKSACPWYGIEPYNPKLSRRNVECTAWQDHVVDRIEQLRPAAVVFSSGGHYLVQGADGIHAPDDAALLDAARNMVGRVRDAADSVLVLMDTPRAPFEPPLCIARASASGKDAAQACAFAPEPPTGLGMEALNRVGATRAVDVRQWVCPSLPCVPDRDGVIVFRDSHHLSATFSRSLADRLEAELLEAMPAS